MSSPAHAARAVRRELRSLARPVGELDISRYFRAAANLDFYNVGAARLRSMAGAIYRTHRTAWSMDEAIDFAEALITSRVLDVKAVGIELTACYRQSFDRRLLATWKRWLSDGYASNWATTDSICGLLIGPLLLDFPDLVPRLGSWVRHRSLWIRRASAVSLIPSVRRGRALDEAYLTAVQLHADGEDLIQKAVGWMLREAGKSDPARLNAYLRANGPTIARTTVRYAIERFPEAQRKELLRSTK